MTLGELRILLANVKDKTKRVFINFGMPCVPSKIESWRGDYSEAAMTFRRSNISDEDPTVADVIAMIDKAYADIHVGYKGGDYTFDPNTRVWLAEHGWSGNCSIERVVDDGNWAVYLIPGYDTY